MKNSVKDRKMDANKDDTINREKRLTPGAVRVMEMIIQDLTAPGCHNRIHGTRACLRAARVIENCFISMGLEKLPRYNKFSLATPPWSLLGRNVFGILASKRNVPGPGVILVVAHHDLFKPKGFNKRTPFLGADAGMRQSRPKCNIFGQARRPAPTKACRGDSLWSPGSKKFDFDAALGADDNASGVALMCAAAADLKERNPDLGQQVVFLSTTGEEKKWIGAKWAVTQLRKAGLSPISVVVIDMVGRLHHEKIYIGGVGTSPQLASVVKQLSGKNNLEIIAVDGPAWAGEEKIFYESGFPSLFVTTGRHEDYHTANDLPDRLNFPGMIWIGALVLELLEDIANVQGKFELQHTKLTPPIYQEQVR
jgi:hypothetical protein